MQKIIDAFNSRMQGMGLLFEDPKIEAEYKDQRTEVMRYTISVKAIMMQKWGYFVWAREGRIF